MRDIESADRFPSQYRRILEFDDVDAPSYRQHMMNLTKCMYGEIRDGSRQRPPHVPVTFHPRPMRP